MTNQEAIEVIKLAQAQVEWEYPMDYAAAFDLAISALQAQEAKLDTISRTAAIDAITDENIIRNMDSVVDSEMHRVKRSVHRIIASIL